MEQNGANPLTSHRTPSLKSHTSIASSMSNLFHRRKRESITHVLSDHDQGSVLSSPIQGRPNFPGPRTIKRQGSNSSFTTTRSNHIPHDLRSVSSKRSLRSAMTSSDFDGPPRSTTRSLRGEPPPSAFHASHHALLPPSWSKDSESSRSAAEIRAEIIQTEMEERTVLAALSSKSTLPAHLRTMSNASQPHATRRRSKLGSQDISQRHPMPLRDHNATINATKRIPSPSASLSGHDVSGVEEDMVDLHYRQIEIAERYRQRLDYLRARLKGAELHERLIRR